MTLDLAEHHHPVSEFTEIPQTADQWASFRLSPQQVEHFHEFGYVAGIRILTEDQVETLKEQLENFFDPNHRGRELWYEYHTNESADPDTILFHALGAWRIQPAFHDLLWHPALTVPASQLLGGAVRFWHDQLFCKPANHGGVVAWHQDYSYWQRTKPLAHLTCWIGLDESTAANGCLQYVPQSHRWELLPITGLAGDMNAIREVLDDKQWEALNNPVHIELAPGECSFHHGLMVHGSQENRTERPRRATVVNLFRDGVVSAAAEPLLHGVSVVPPGQKMQGKFFPLLHDPAENPRE